jgi:hypothetical protein
MSDEISTQEFIEYLNKDSYFINWLGGSDIKAHVDHKNKLNNVEYYITYISEWNGYYDLSNDKNSRKENLDKYFELLYEIYMNNKYVTNLCEAYEYLKPSIKFNDLKYINYHHYIEHSFNFFKYIMP